MRARLIVFPVRARNWCFGRSIDNPATASSHSPSKFKDLWNNVSFKTKPFNANAELFVDFIANKMNKAWTGFEKAPDGSFKKKVYGLGLRLLSRVKPSEIFLRSITKEVSNVEVIYPSSLNDRLVRRRLRHIAMRGTVIHKKYFYGSITLLPLTTAFTVLPFPNIPFFWLLFRTYSHWRALQGSEKLFQLVSDSIKAPNSTAGNGNKSEGNGLKHETRNSNGPSWVLHPSKELEELTRAENRNDDGLDEGVILEICKTYDLNAIDVVKYKHSV